MTRADMIEIIRNRTDCRPTQAVAAADQLFDDIAGELAAGGTVPLPGTGTLKRVATKARPNGRNLHTGEPVAIPAGHQVKLTQAKAMKARLAALATHQATQAAAE